MNQINAHKAGLTLGIVIATIHVFWVVVVLLGLGQMLADFSLWAHMVYVAYIVGPADITATLTLIVSTGVAGYIIGWLFATVWNRLNTPQM